MLGTKSDQAKHRDGPSSRGPNISNIYDTTSASILAELPAYKEAEDHNHYFNLGVYLVHSGA